MHGEVVVRCAWCTEAQSHVSVHCFSNRHNITSVAFFFFFLFFWLHADTRTTWRTCRGLCHPSSQRHTFRLSAIWKCDWGAMRWQEQKSKSIVNDFARVRKRNKKNRSFLVAASARVRIRFAFCKWTSARSRAHHNWCLKRHFQLFAFLGRLDKKKKKTKYPPSMGTTTGDDRAEANGCKWMKCHVAQYIWYFKR